MKLRNKVSYLNVLPDDDQPRKLSSSFTVVIYFSILGGILLYLLFYALSGFFYITARGHVELSKYFVQTDRNGKISRFLVRPGEKVVPGQPLFEITEQSEKKRGFRSGSVVGRTNGSLQAQMLSLEQVLSGLKREEGIPSGWASSGGAFGSRQLVRVVSDIQYAQSKLKEVNRDIQRKTDARGVLWDGLSKERVLELSKFGKRAIPVQVGVSKNISKLNREIVRREDSLSSFQESLIGWKAFKQSLAGQGEGEPEILLSRDMVRINNEIESRGAALLLMNRQLTEKIESRDRVKSGFTEVRILELEKGRKGGSTVALDNAINDLTYQVADIENKVDSLVRYRKDLVNNEIKSNEYKIRDEIKKIVALRRERMEGSEQYKVIAKEHKFVALEQSIQSLVSKRNTLQNKLDALTKTGSNLAENEIEKLRFEISREQNENDPRPGGASGSGGYVFRPVSGYGNFVSAPVEGSVVLLYRREGEYAKKGDVLLSIRETGADVRVKGFLKTRNMGSIQLEKEVEVNFPDKTSSPGVIKRFYSSLSKNTGDTLPPAIDPPEIVIDIVPRDPSDASLWERYDQLEVSVEVRK